jgi:cytochrome c oxidase cbb3-type subunit 4
MTYESLQQLAGMAGLFLFIGLFTWVLIYALNPRNRSTFDAAARSPLDRD